jgi:hypothetical protein
VVAPLEPGEAVPPVQAVVVPPAPAWVVPPAPVMAAQSALEAAALALVVAAAEMAVAAQPARAVADQVGFLALWPRTASLGEMKEFLPGIVLVVDSYSFVSSFSVMSVRLVRYVEFHKECGTC